MGRIRDSAELRVRQYILEFLKNNRAARVLSKELEAVGVGLWPLVDHVTVRTMDVERRAGEFVRLGFKWDRSLGKSGVVEYDDWWAKVYRKPGLPAIFIDQAFAGDFGKTSVIPPWVRRFSDRVLHHIAVRVDDISGAVRALRERGIHFSGPIVGAPSSDLRQIFTLAEERHGHPFTVLEIIERHRGYQGFQPPQADSLMKASLRTKRNVR